MYSKIGIPETRDACTCVCVCAITCKLECLLSAKVLNIDRQKKNTNWKLCIDYIDLLLELLSSAYCGINIYVIFISYCMYLRCAIEKTKQHEIGIILRKR